VYEGRRPQEGGGRRKERPEPETLDPSTGRWSAGVQGVGDCDGDERLGQHQRMDFGLAPRGRCPWRRSDFAWRSFQVSRTRSASEASGRGTGSPGDVGSRSAHFPHIDTITICDVLQISSRACARQRTDSCQNSPCIHDLRYFGSFFLATIAQSPLKTRGPADGGDCLSASGPTAGCRGVASNRCQGTKLRSGSYSRPIA